MVIMRFYDFKRHRDLTLNATNMIVLALGFLHQDLIAHAENTERRWHYHNLYDYLSDKANAIDSRVQTAKEVLAIVGIKEQEDD